MGKKSYVKKKAKGSSTLAYLPFYLIIGLLPHVFLYNEYSTLDAEKKFFTADTYSDLLTLAKAKLFWFLALVILVVFIYRAVRKKVVFRFDGVTMVTIVFSVMLALSVILSEYGDLALAGVLFRYEGMFTIFGYLILFTAARHYCHDELFRKRSAGIFIASASIHGIIGILQIFDADIYLGTFLKYFLIPARILDDPSKQLVTHYSEQGAVGALYNPNYFGVYIAMALAASVIAMFLSKNKNKYHISNAILIFALYASKSETGFLCFAGFLIVYVIFELKRILADKRSALILSACFVTETAIYYFVKGLDLSRYQYLFTLLILGIAAGAAVNMLLKSLLKLGPGKAGIILTSLITASVVGGMLAVTLLLPDTKRPFKLNDIGIVDDVLIMDVEGQGDIRMIFGDLDVDLFINGEEKSVVNAEKSNRLLYDSGTLKYTFDMYKSQEMVGTELYRCTVWPSNVNILCDGGHISFLDFAGNIVQLEDPAGVWLLEEKGGVFSSRGYIWSKSIRIFLRKPLTGYGPDTYIMYFPNNDFVGIYNNFKVHMNETYPTTVIDKPHSAYIQVFFGMGMVNGLIFIIFIIYALYRGIKKHLEGDEDLTGLAVLLIFALGSIFNDSTIAVTALSLCFISAVYRTESGRTVK